MEMLSARYSVGPLYSRTAHSLAARKTYFADEARTLVKVNFAFLVLFLVAYILLFVFSILAVVRSRGHRLPYIVLFIGISFNVLSRILGVALTLLQYDPEFSRLSYYDASAASGTFYWLGTILPTLAILMILWNRADLLQHMRPDRAVCGNLIKKAFDVALAGLWFIFGVTRVGLATSFNKSLTTGTRDADEYRRQGNTLYGLLDVLNVFVFAIIINIGITALVLRSRISSVTTGDTPTSRVAFVVFPLLLVEFLYELGSTIFYQYKWDNKSPLTRSASDIENLVGTIISSSLLFIAYLVLLTLGINQTAWNTLGDQAGKPQWNGQVYQPQYQPQYQPGVIYQQPGMVYQPQVVYQQQHPIYGQPAQAPAENGVVAQQPGIVYAQQPGSRMSTAATQPETPAQTVPQA